MQIVNFIDLDCEVESYWVEVMVVVYYFELKKKIVVLDGVILLGFIYGYGNIFVDKFYDYFGILNGRIKMNGEGFFYVFLCNILIRIFMNFII